MFVEDGGYLGWVMVDEVVLRCVDALVGLGGCGAVVVDITMHKYPCIQTRVYNMQDK